MTEKEEALAVIGALPPDATLADCFRELAFNKMVDNGLRDAETGLHISTDDLRKAVASWRR
jgi:hypothetical protein